MFALSKVLLIGTSFSLKMWTKQNVSVSYVLISTKVFCLELFVTVLCNNRKLKFLLGSPCYCIFCLSMPQLLFRKLYMLPKFSFCFKSSSSCELWLVTICTCFVSPRFGIAHALCLGLAPWLAAEIPILVDSGMIKHKDDVASSSESWRFYFSAVDADGISIISGYTIYELN